MNVDRTSMLRRAFGCKTSLARASYVSNISSVAPNHVRSTRPPSPHKLRNVTRSLLRNKTQNWFMVIANARDGILPKHLSSGTI